MRFLFIRWEEGGGKGGGSGREGMIDIMPRACVPSKDYLIRRQNICWYTIYCTRSVYEWLSNNECLFLQGCVCVGGGEGWSLTSYIKVYTDVLLNLADFL